MFALSGLTAANESLLAWYKNPQDVQAAGKMAYAALLSGICLAQTGLGSVHGLAAPLGCFFPIGHGVVFGTLLSQATQVNIDVMKQREPENPALDKYADIGRLLAKRSDLESDAATEYLLHTLIVWTQKMKIPNLSALGVVKDDIPKIVDNSRGSSMQTNPVKLTDEEISRILLARLDRE